MQKDRLIQAGALTVALVALLGSVVLVPSINKDRRDLRLGFDTEIGDRVPPKYALAAAALGSFRGIAADSLWYRLEMLKRDGKYFEADTLSRWIVTLQPRFPRVWQFMAWNMAYNISVETHTPEERWSWVNKGIRLLREEGIPYNPHAFLLYNELSWHFFHKLGKNTDDMHLYYKYRLAMEWEEVLGDIHSGRSEQGVYDAFLPIALRAEEYLVFDRPTYQMQAELRELIEAYKAREVEDDEADTEMVKLLYKMEAMSLVQFRSELGNLRDELERRGEDPDELIATLEELLVVQEARASRGEGAFAEDFPDAIALADRMESELGLQMDRDGLRTLGRVFMGLNRLEREAAVLFAEASPGEMVVLGQDAEGQDVAISREDYLTGFALIRETDIPTFAFVVNLFLNEQDRLPVLFEELLPYWRARVLINDYQMDPGFMYTLMQTYGPLDWRHPGSHGIYWASIGVQKALQVYDVERTDLINTQRRVIHGLQMLWREGTLTLNRDARHHNNTVLQSPDFRFIPAYEQAVFGSVDLYLEMEGAREGAVEHFEAGHENFMIDVVVYALVWGEQDLANAYYQRVRRLYGDKPKNQRDGRYLVAVDEFVARELAREVTDTHHMAGTYIYGSLTQAFRVGLGQGEFDAFLRSVRLAEGVYRQYQEAYSDENNANAGEGSRLHFPPWNELVPGAFVRFLSDGQYEEVTRRRAWLNAPVELQQASYDNLRERLSARYEGRFEQLFPPPAGYTGPREVERESQGGTQRTE